MVAPLNRRTLAALACGVLVCAPALWYRGDIQRSILFWQILRQDHVDAGIVEELATMTTDPLPQLQQLWESGRIPHRQAAIRTYCSLVGADRQPSSPPPAWITEASQDLDLSVREPALNRLVFRDSIRAQPLLVRALHDADPEVRLLAMRHMRSAEFRPLAGHVIRQLEHPDLGVALAADAVLRAWTGQDRGVRLSRLAGNWNEETAVFEPLSSSEIAQVRLDLQRWQAWWVEHRSGFPEAAIPTDLGPSRLSAPLFRLMDLDRKPVSLADYRGRTVLLSFWATWCSACWEEIPKLVELRRAHSDDLEIIGICLDSANDPDPADPEEAAAAGSGTGDRIGNRVREFVKRRGINYRVVLDPTAKVGDAYASQELPTHVLIDPQGAVRRRFVGGRTVAGYESMLVELRSEARSVARR